MFAVHTAHAFSRFAVRALLLSSMLLISAPWAEAQGAGDPPPDTPPSPVAPELSFEAQAVTVAGATPGGGVVVFGLGREWTGYMHRVLRREQRLEADPTGALTWELEEPVIARSVWVAVDLATGEYALGAPEGHEIERVELPAEGLGANARFLQREGRYLDLLLVRPASGPEGEEGVGFWGLDLRDGGEQDRDGQADSRLSIDILDLTPLGESAAAPERWLPRDVVVGVDPQTLRVFAQQLANGPDGESNGGDAGEAE